MRLIIDIPKSIYDKICLNMMRTEIDNPNLYFESLISNGTPIPYNAKVCDIEKIIAKIKNIKDMEIVNGGVYVREFDVIEIIDKYTKGEDE